MGKRSTKDNKNIYQTAREEAGLTRSKASSLMPGCSESRIEKIEYGTAYAQPEDIIAMAEAYKKPSLCNYYCANECRIGQEYVPEVKVSSLAEISLGILSSLNALDKQKERLVDITVDGKITDDELPDFVNIQKNLEQISLTIDSFKLWLNNTIMAGEINKEKLDELKK